MTNRSFRVLPIALVCLLVVALLTGAAFSQALNANVQQQIRDLLQEKEGRTHAQRKLASRLIYAAKAMRGERIGSNTDVMTNALKSLDARTSKGVLVDIKGNASTDLENAITRSGGMVIYTSRRGNAIRARVPLGKLEKLAERNDVVSVRPAPIVRLGSANAMTHLGQTPLLPFIPRSLPFAISTGSTTSQGMIAHNAAFARTFYGVDGSGIKVGVLSDSAEAIPLLIGTGDLPPDTMNVADIVDGPGTSEGSAMMEIVHDLAPGSQLFFASAFNSPDSFADNIRLLRFTYGCDVIADDVSWSDESPFEDSVIAQAVDDVVADGAIYFSSAGNNGNTTNGNSSAWEGDFNNGGTNPVLPMGYTVHNFGTQNFDRLLITTGVLDLFWSDPLGNSTNDYDLFVLNATGTALIASSTDTQNGVGDDPFEEIAPNTGLPANSQVVIAAKPGAQQRALHLDAFFGEPLQIQTTGVSRGHNAGLNTVGVAAVAWNSGRPLGIKPFTGGSKNPTEVFSSDGFRRIFYDRNGNPLTPGNLLFSTNGGNLLIKPEIAAADGVSTRTPGFSPFFGTSAASPHAAGIAALARQLNPSATVSDIRNAMTSTALDIRAPGIDPDSGYGIVMAPQTLGALPH
jgi:hypothetical protein